MNIFRLFGDMSHLLAIAVLVWKIWKTRSCAGISGKAQGLFALVFATRYLDLFTTFLSFYNSGMKVLFLTGALGTVYLIFVKFKATYDNSTSSSKLDNFIKRRHHDTFRVIYLIIPCAAMAFLVNHDFTPIEIMWTFSIYLESVAIMPQLFMLSKTGQAETITSHYLFLLGMYRALYICNWVYRYHLEDYFDPIAVVAGAIQTILYADFFYLYITRVLQGGGAIQLSA